MLTTNSITMSFSEIKKQLKNKFNIDCKDIYLESMFEDGWFLEIEGDNELANFFHNGNWREENGAYYSACNVAQSNNVNSQSSKSVIFDIIEKIIEKEVVAYVFCIDLLKNNTDKFEQITVFTK